MFTFTVLQYTLTYKFKKPNNAQIRKLIYAHLNKKKNYEWTFEMSPNISAEYLQIVFIAIRTLDSNPSFQ